NAARAPHASAEVAHRDRDGHGLADERRRRSRRVHGRVVRRREHVGRRVLLRTRKAAGGRDRAGGGRARGRGVARVCLVDERETAHRQGREGEEEKRERAAHVVGTWWLVVYDDERGLALTLSKRTRSRPLVERAASEDTLVRD